jgi:RNA polymerase sigma-70 factor, ECF subfamily
MAAQHATTDDALLLAVRSGDAAALTALLERHAATVYRFGLKMCRNPEDAEDVVQETLLAAAQGLRDFRGDASLHTWLYTVARSYCIKKHRSSKFAPSVLESLETSPTATRIAGAAPGPDDVAERRELGQVLEAALDQLSPEYREVLMLRDVEGFTAPEVAEITSVSVDAVKSRLHRARADLRARLEPYFPSEEQVSEATKTPSCPEILSVFSRYLEGDIGATECDAMQAHVAGCKRCDAACTSLRHSLSLCRAAQPTEIPASVKQMVKNALRTLTSAG